MTEQEATRPPVHGRVEARVSRDQLEGYLMVVPPRDGGSPATIEDAAAALQKVSIRYGLDEEAVIRAVEAQSGDWVLVARGVPAQNGRDARISFNFPTEGQSSRPRENDTGRVDHRELGGVINVVKDQPLAVKTPATSGTRGLGVTGVELPPKPGRDVPLLAGPGVELSADQLTLTATIDGQPVLGSRDRVSVVPIHEVRQNVDYSVGNIDFVGTVVVRGNVMAGFKITAQQDIKVNGHVYGAFLHAGGDVAVGQGIQGGGKGYVQAGGNVQARFIENAVVKAGGDVTSGEAIMHSDVQAKGAISVEGRKGLLVGGRARAGRDVRTRSIGSPLATPTEVEVGLDPEVRDALSAVTGELKEVEEGIARLQRAIRQIKESSASPEELSPERRQLVARLTREQVQLTGRREKLLPCKEELSETLEEAYKGRVKASEVLYPGVKVIIGQAAYSVRDEIKHSSLYLGPDGKVTVGALS